MTATFERPVYQRVSFKHSRYGAHEWQSRREFITEQAGEQWRERTAETQPALVKLFLESPMFAIRNFFRTTSKEGEIVRLDPWRGQLIHDISLESQRRIGYPQRVVEIKARQVGFTAWNLARGFWAALHPHMQVLCLVNDETVANRLMERVGEMYNNLPRFLRPMKRIDNVGELVLDNPDVRSRYDRPGLGSRYVVAVPNSLRGATPNFFIWSEAAFCEPRYVKKIKEGVLGGIAKGPRSCVIIDTTPNGYDDFYWPLVKEAVERNPKWVARWERKGPPTRDEILAGILGEPDRPKEGYVPSFCPWHWHEEYTTKNEEPFFGQLPAIEEADVRELAATLGKDDRYGGDEEVELVERYGVSLYRIFWRRWTLDNDTIGADHYERLLTFRQEYLTRWDSGFVSLGRGAFDPRGLDCLGRRLPGKPWGPRPPLVRGALMQDHRGIGVDTTFYSDYLEVRIWALPSPDEEYVIGVDTSTAYHNLEADANCAQIVRRRDRKQVGIIHGRVPQHEFREQVRLAYFWYNKAYLGIEMENNGYDLAYTLWKSGCTNQYMYRRFDQPVEEAPTKYLGWESNPKANFTAQNILVEAVAKREPDGKTPAPDMIICDDLTFQELQDVTRDPEGWIGNWSGGHDDTYSALKIAFAIDEDPWKPYSRRVPREEKPELNALVERMGLKLEGSSGRNRPEFNSL